MQEEKYEVVLINFNRAITRSVRTFSLLDEARARAERLNEEIDKEKFPSVGWVVMLNPCLEEAEQ